MGAKQTSQLIPLCHNIPLDKVNVELSLNLSQQCIHIEAMAKTQAYTGDCGPTLHCLPPSWIYSAAVHSMCMQVLLTQCGCAVVVEAVFSIDSWILRVSCLQVLKWKQWWAPLWRRSLSMTCAKHWTREYPFSMSDWKQKQVAKAVITTVSDQGVAACSREVQIQQTLRCAGPADVSVPWGIQLYDIAAYFPCL